jgi:hypothetical protein
MSEKAFRKVTSYFQIRGHRFGKYDEMVQNYEKYSKKIQYNLIFPQD